MHRPLLALALATGLATAQGLPCHDLTAIDAIAASFLNAYPVTGDCCVRIDQRGTPLHASAHGSFTLQEVVAIASATKTLSAAVLMSLVDEGRLSLDDRVGQYLPEYATGALAAITLRMCFTHTAGMATSDPSISDNSITLREAARRLALVPLLAPPGTAFAYGGVSMHVAGAVCEVASGRSWAQLFQQKLAGPLQFTSTDYYAFGLTLNPRIAGGARSGLRDYAAFVEMLRNGGRWNGQQVLSTAAVETMLTDQTSGLPVIATPHPENAPYGVGIWLDRRDRTGRTLTATAAGAFGFVGWIDRAHAATGVFLTLNHYPNVHPYLRSMWSACDDALLPDGTSCLGYGTPACASGAWLTADRPPRTGDADFGFQASHAPANALGGLLLGALSSAPSTVFDLDAFVSLPGAVFTPLLADAAGRARLPAPLGLVPTGVVLGAQCVWFDPTACGAVGLQASHALGLTTLP